jgi:protein O-mannosyl-transferase
MKYENKQVPGMQGVTGPKANSRSDFYFLPFLLFIISSFLLYLPVISRQFVSDDYKVLYRVCIEQNLFIKGFFRPLSDISIFMNYKLAGFNPVLFNSFNIIIHGINSYLVYLACMYFFNSVDPYNKKHVALFSSFIFLSYPFHNEAIVWLLGRGASMACMFSLLAVICYYKTANIMLKHFLVCFFYFLSISAFESTIIFPILFILLLWGERQTDSVIGNWSIWLFSTLLIQLFLRYCISGSLMGNYGAEFFHSGIKTYFLHGLKICGRLFLPPAENAFLITSVFILSVAVVTWLLFKNMRKIRRLPVWRKSISLSGMLLIACIVPAISGISTQTSETDRALYFPSVFLSIIIGLFMVYGIKKLSTRTVTLLLILAYNIFFLEKNNKNWIEASAITKSVVDKTLEISSRQKTAGRVYFLNIPNEISGAYVFRLGFSDALRVYKADTNRFTVVNYLPRQDIEKMKVKFILHPGDDSLLLPPDITMKTEPGGCRTVYDHGKLRFTSRPDDHIFFWNVDELEEIQSCILRKPA